MSIPSFRILTALLVVTSILRADPISEAEQHLQAREYGPAATKLSAIKDNDRAAYLHATALFLDKKYPAAESAAAGFLKTHADSKWATKTRFLLARALIEQQKHKAAELIALMKLDRRRLP